jgi:beta-glucosidase
MINVMRISTVLFWMLGLVGALPLYSQTNDARIEALIKQMTVEEKVGQMTQLNLDVVCEGGIYKLVEPHHLDPAKLREALVKYHVGSILNCGGHAYPRKQWLEIIGGIQKVATTETRLKIPVVYGIDAIHGANYVSKSTLFPQQLAQAATFNPALTLQASEITAYETRSAGMTWNFSPVLDVARNPLWSRVFETYGEDALVCSRFGEAAVRGYQGKAEPIDNQHVAACMKHFLAYGGNRTGKDRTPAYLSDIQLREIYLPPFRKAIETGALTVMINSGEINGIPVHADKRILTGLLRDELKFDGVAVTDWEDVMKLHLNHKVAPNLKEATFMAVEAGIDMCMVPNDYDFTKLLIELVKEGRISEARLDVSVRRILKLKQKLGILDKVNVPSEKDYEKFAAAEHRAAARKTAEEAITLLENRNNILPLKANQKIFVTGPAAHSMSMLNGAWTRTWQGVDTLWDDPSNNTILEALKVASANVTYAPGCGIDTELNLTEALNMARQSDVIVACMGEKPSTEKPGDIDDLSLSRAQLNYLNTLIATGRPVVLVLVENRPRLVSEVADRCAAVVMAYQPGDTGGDVLADILMGNVNPSGKLPLTYPRFNHSLLWYDHKYTETFDVNFGNKAFNPQWEFGHGLSYSNLKYSSLSVSKSRFTGDESITIEVVITNPSDREAKESVLLFSRDHFASVTPSVKKLRDFTKISLKAGESQTVHFILKASDLSFVGVEGKAITEPGDFDLMIGTLSTTITYEKP